jgi:hypothetical protein
MPECWETWDFGIGSDTTWSMVMLLYMEDLELMPLLYAKNGLLVSIENVMYAVLILNDLRVWCQGPYHFFTNDDFLSEFSCNCKPINWILLLVKVGRMLHHNQIVNGCHKPCCGPVTTLHLICIQYRHIWMYYKCYTCTSYWKVLLVNYDIAVTMWHNG